jgi:phospholipid-binding lipoprotein MlaA
MLNSAFSRMSTAGLRKSAVARLAPLAVGLSLLGGCAWLPDLQETNGQPYMGQGHSLQYASMADGEYVSSDIADIAVDGDDLISDGDPLEIFNRFMFAINDTLDIFVIKPVAVTYRRWVPDGVQTVVDNFLTHLREPVNFANSVFQGDWEQAETTGSRFLINSAIGFGMFDPATGLGLEHRDEDFGQTLAVWGAPSGPYLVLPLLGPNTVRSTAGRGVDMFLDPFGYFTGNIGVETAGLEVTDDYEALGYSRTVGEGINQRSQLIDELDEVRSDAIDYYARIRSLWIQQRRREILNETSPGMPDIGALPEPTVSTEPRQVSAQ